MERTELKVGDLVSTFLGDEVVIVRVEERYNKREGDWHGYYTWHAVTPVIISCAAAWFCADELTLLVPGYLTTVRQMRQYFNENFQDVCIGCGDEGAILKGDVNLDTGETALTKGFCEFCCAEEDLTDEDKQYLEAIKDVDLW